MEEQVIRFSGKSGGRKAIFYRVFKYQDVRCLERGNLKARNLLKKVLS